MNEKNTPPRQKKTGPSFCCKYKLTLEYDGTGYRGWQTQKNARSVQGTLIDSASKLFGQGVEIQGAGRTDAGVHAMAQVAHLEAPRRLPPQKILFELNDLLPASINILKVEETSDKFHARHTALSRSYLYLLSCRRTAFLKRYVWWVKDELDLEKMQKAMKIFSGFHDFSSFADKRIDKNLSTEVQIERLELSSWGDMIVFRIAGSHFLWKMVRRIVGILVEAGRGNISPYDVEKLLNSHSDVPAHYTAPPSGLFLEKVIYPGDSLAPLAPPSLLFSGQH